MGLLLGKFGFNTNEKIDTKKSNDLKKIEAVCKPLNIGNGKELPQLTEYYNNLLKQLPEPKIVFKHFMICLQTPRCDTLTILFFYRCFVL